MDGGAWQVTVRWVTKESDVIQQLNNTKWGAINLNMLQYVVEYNLKNLICSIRVMAYDNTTKFSFILIVKAHELEKRQNSKSCFSIRDYTD